MLRVDTGRRARGSAGGRYGARAAIMAAAGLALLVCGSGILSAAPNLTGKKDEGFQTGVPERDPDRAQERQHPV